MADAPKTDPHTTTADIASIKFTLRELIEEVSTLIWEKRQFITGKIERRQIGEPEKNLALLRIRRLEVLLAYLKAGNNPVAEPEAPRAKTAEELGRSEQAIVRDFLAGRPLIDGWTPDRFTDPLWRRIYEAVVKVGGNPRDVTYAQLVVHLPPEDERWVAMLRERPKVADHPHEVSALYVDDKLMPEPPAEEPTIDLDDF